MKRMTKKLGAIVLAMAMCLSLCCTALVSAADEGTYTITISNTTQGYEYAAYKIFDATVGTEGNVAYSIQTSNPWFGIITTNLTPDETTGVYTTDLFVLTPTDETTYTVTVKEGVEDSAIITYFNNQIVMTEQEDGTYKLTAPDGVTAAASDNGNGGKLPLDVSETGAGYYFVTSTLGATVTITTTDPKADVIDKNTPPGNLSKKMVALDEESDDVHAGTSTVGDDVEFIVTADVPLYAPGDDESHNGYLVVNYEFDDEMTIGLEIRGLTENVDYEYEGGRYWATDKLINEWITLTQGENTYTFTEVAYDYTLELIYPSEDENENLQFDGFILQYRTVDEDTWEKLQQNEEGQYYTDASEISTNYPVNAQITIDYTAHITEDVDYENTNHIDMHWGLTPFNNPHTPEYTGHDYDEDEVYVLELDIEKLDEETRAALAGAEFKLTGTNLNQVINGTSYVFESLTYDEYLAAKTNEKEMWFALEDGSGISFAGSNTTYTNVDPYDLIAAAGENMDEKTAAELARYAVDEQTSYYPYVAYTLTVTHTGELQPVDEDYSVTGTTDSDGHLKFVGLTVGEYTLTEIKAPDGYNLLPEELTFTVSVTFDNNDQPTWTITSGEGQSTVFTYSDGVVSVTILNSQGTPLPSTGGIGTTIFYIIGGVLVVGAVVVLVTRRRMTREG